MRMRPFRAQTFATLDDARVRLDGDAAVIELGAGPERAVRLELGPSARTLSDQDILDLHNQRVLRGAEALAAGINQDAALILAELGRLLAVTRPTGEPRRPWPRRRGSDARASVSRSSACSERCAPQAPTPRR